MELFVDVDPASETISLRSLVRLLNDVIFPVVMVCCLY